MTCDSTSHPAEVRLHPAHGAKGDMGDIAPPAPLRFVTDPSWVMNFQTGKASNQVTYVTLRSIWAFFASCHGVTLDHGSQRMSPFAPFGR